MFDAMLWTQWRWPGSRRWRLGDDMDRRAWLNAASAVVLSATGVTVRAQTNSAMPSSLRSLAVVDFELVDDQNNPLTKAAQEARLRNATLQLQQELAQRQLYRMVDPAPSQELQSKLRLQQEFLYRCDDCAEQVGRLLGVDLVMVTWVQKVSELILNLNVQIYDVKGQKVVFTKSVDMRGNNDESWVRGVRYLVRDMAEKRERNPSYGQ